MLTISHLIVKDILKDISLNFEPGKIHGLMGPNGSGKSTLLRCLAGIQKYDSGSIRWKQTDLNELERSSRAQIVAFVPQTPAPLFDFTVEEMVAMGRFAHVTPRSQQAPYVERALDQVNALPFLKRPLSTLSVGERQRIYIARALATEAPVLLLDEPTSSLDAQHENELASLLQSLASQGKLIILSLHNVHLAERLLDTTTLLDKGTLRLCKENY